MNLGILNNVVSNFTPSPCPLPLKREGEQVDVKGGEMVL